MGPTFTCTFTHLILSFLTNIKPPCLETCVSEDTSLTAAQISDDHDAMLKIVDLGMLKLQSMSPHSKRTCFGILI